MLRIIAVLSAVLIIPWPVLAGEFGDAATDLENTVKKQQGEILILRGNVSELDARLQALEEGQPPPEVGCEGYSIPGRIQVENFAEGGQGVAYNDTTPDENLGGAYRLDEGVDVKITGDVDGEFQIGYIVNGEWVKLATCVEAGTYDVTLRVTSASNTPGEIEVILDDAVLGRVAVPNTGSWDTNFVNVVIPKVEVAEGKQTLQLNFSGKSFDINWIEFSTPDTQALWEDDFSGDWRSRWPLKWSEPDDRYATKEYFERDGETWIRVIYPEGETGKGFKLVTDHNFGDRVYLEYKLRFADDFDWVIGGKIPGLIGGSVAAGEKPDGTDGWAARVMWAADGKGFAYVYHPDMPGQWGENIHFPSTVRFQKGVIHTMGLEVIMNTPRQYDGVLRVWLDDVLAVERTNMRWRDVSELQIDGMSFGSIFGGNTPAWAPSKDERAEYGDFKFYSSR